MGSTERGTPVALLELHDTTSCAAKEVSIHQHATCLQGVYMDNASKLGTAQLSYASVGFVGFCQL